MANLARLGLGALAAAASLVLSGRPAEAQQGCCSHHGGVAGCSEDGRAVCADGTPSPSCRCNQVTWSMIASDGTSRWDLDVMTSGNKLPMASFGLAATGWECTQKPIRRDKNFELVTLTCKPALGRSMSVTAMCKVNEPHTSVVTVELEGTIGKGLTLGVACRRP